MKTTPEKITSLAENEIFVFGSNLAGIHGAGAALLAHLKFGAEIGKGFGLTGQCFAIPTKDRKIETLPLSNIGIYLAMFLKIAKENPHKLFLVTAVGCGLAGYSPDDIAPLFFRHGIPDNVSLPESFWKLKPTS